MRYGLLVVDIQERLMPVIDQKDRVIKRSQRLIEAFRLLDYPIIVTEQYPKGLGSAIAELAIKETPITKTRFSALTPEVKEAISNLEHIVIIGVETHVCVYQTVRDLIKEGLEVSVAVDAVSSRFEEDRKIGLKAIQRENARLVTSEMILYEMLGDANHPQFKEVLKLVR